MAFSNGSNLWIKGYFKECPSCHKKGFYLPRCMIVKTGYGTNVTHYPLTCKYCGFEKGTRWVE